MLCVYIVAVAGKRSIGGLICAARDVYYNARAGVLG